jgi:hypothetical protein
VQWIRIDRADGPRPSGKALAYFVAAMVLDTFASLAALLYAINLSVDGQPHVPRSPTWWNPFHHAHLVSGPVRPWVASALLAACAGVGVLASRRAISAPRIAVQWFGVCAVLAYIPSYLTPQPIVLWGLPMFLAFVAAAVAVKLGANAQTRTSSSESHA